MPAVTAHVEQELMNCQTTQDGRQRVVIEAVEPSVDGGRFPIKRTVGDTIVVEADVFADGHDVVRADLLVRFGDGGQWQRCPLEPLGNDRWRASFDVDRVGRWQYSIQGWVDAFHSWQRDLKKRIDAGQDVSVDLLIGAQLVGQAAERAAGADAVQLRQWSSLLSDPQQAAERTQLAISERLLNFMDRYPDLRFATSLECPIPVTVDVVRARFSAWYEMFPRSTATEPGRHGTFRDCIARLPYVASMGFDVVYLPPIHPIGQQFRKGKNNATTAQAGEPGSPWAIGGAEGGHKSIHPELGTLEDFHALIAAAKGHGIDIAIDIAFQSSPDHPYVKEHPEWFRHRPDGTVQYAENPPKKYQDIYPFDFETPAWQSMWRELTDVVLYWCQQGVRIFRVDNPHTKALAFWEFLIGEVKAQYPEAIFLSEAFTRPKIMYRLAKLGFTQSYTYFTWRNSKQEFIEYLTELTQTKVREFFQPNFWPNTPDILPPHIQTGGRPASIARVVLAATLSSNYGLYGPTYELLETTPREEGSEEYFNSEKYEIRHWNLDQPHSLRDIIAQVNRARREHPALQHNRTLRFHAIDNDQLLCYSKQSLDRTDTIVCVVNLDFHNKQQGMLGLPLAELGFDPQRPLDVTDLLDGSTFRWTDERNFVALNPHERPAHVFHVRQ